MAASNRINLLALLSQMLPFMFVTLVFVCSAACMIVAYLSSTPYRGRTTAVFLLTPLFTVHHGKG